MPSALYRKACICVPCVSVYTCVTWLIHMCDMPPSYVWHDSFIRVTWLLHTCDMTHSYVWHDSFIRVTWLIHMCHMTHSYVWHDSFIRVTWLIHTCDKNHRNITYQKKSLWRFLVFMTISFCICCNLYLIQNSYWFIFIYSWSLGNGREYPGKCASIIFLCKRFCQ